MKERILHLLACPSCREKLVIEEVGEELGDEIAEGRLRCLGCRRAYPIVRSIPRFVPPENYAGNFGLQWQHFRRTQLDSYTGIPISRHRFLFSTGLEPSELAGRRVLDVGCGAGRFAEIALSLGADVIALDYSAAIDACRDNLMPHPRLHLVQGDIYALPFIEASFDYIYCFGVLQHTPDVRRAFVSLPLFLRPGARMAVDVYPKLRSNLLWPKYWLRPLTKRMRPEMLLRIVEVLVPVLLPLSDVIVRIPGLGRKLRYFVPVLNHRPDFPSLSPQQAREWAILDTFDMFGPTYDQPQSARTLEKWFREAGLQDVKVFRKGHLIGQGGRPNR